MVGTKGTWLDVLDAGLAGDRLEKDIFFLVTKKEEGLDLFSIKTYMKNHIPDLEIEGHDAPPNRASKGHMGVLELQCILSAWKK